MTKKYFLLFGALIAGIVIQGCYTQLMTIQEFTQARHERAAVRPDASYSLNYNQNCVSCHSVAELDDRYLDLKYYQVNSVHGIALDRNLWSGYTDVPYGDINEYYPRPIYIVQPNPWWLPPATIVTGGNGTPVSTDRTRTTGATRDAGRAREPIPAAQGTTQPPQSTTPVPSTPPAATTTVAPSTTTPSSGSTSGERSRTDSNSSGGSRTRSDGATRDNGNRPR